jgi:xeroderma pigmentosum group C-complementing protein
LPVFTTVPKRRLIEKHRLTNYLRSKPFPTTIKEFKDHPLYVLERDLLKFEAIYPKDTQPLGQIRKENIYPRSTVHVLKNKLTWIKLGRSVVEEEKAYKVVKAAPKLGIPADGMFID